jgi:hypothetical protein
MKEDYLWDKTGEDAEIQSLENALKAFRWQENAPPELPQKVFTIEKQMPRRFFRFGFAFAAFAAAVVVLSVVWLQFSGSESPGAETVAETTAPASAEKTAGESFIETRGNEPASPVATVPAAQPNVVKIRRKSAPVVRARKTIWRRPKIAEPVETLTAEEKHAYNQLMLALSITGTQLKIVKDKVQGIEE